MTILQNYPLVAAMMAIFISQVTKIPVAHLMKRPTTATLMFSTGGMPSSHSAGVTGLITAIVIEYGWTSPLTAISLTFGILVMFDSMGVRRQSGEHGIIINELIGDLQLLSQYLSKSASAEMQEEINEELQNDHLHTREFLGHKPIEVLCGMLYGILISVAIYYLFYI